MSRSPHASQPGSTQALRASGAGQRASRGHFSGVLLAALGLLAGCEQQRSGRIQGYIEGEFVYVASPRSGALTTLEVAKGAQVDAGAPLFGLDGMPEQSARDEAAHELQRAEAELEDKKKGERPSELAASSAALEQARAALDLAEKEVARQEKMQGTAGATTEHDVDRARAERDQDRERVAELEADLETARLGSRADEIAAAEAKVRSLQAALQQAEWELGQKHQSAPQAGLVFDTLYRQGDWVGAGLPVVMLLPPGNVKLRTFVAEGRVGSLQLGDSVRVFVDGVSEPRTGTISYIAPRAEYTPPVVYSIDNRNKFVFLVEAVFEPAVARELHPGQPVEVELAAALP
jgi:HlyD family secretion protein